MKKLVLMLALSAVAVFLFAPAASTTSHYCGYDGYYDDDYHYGYDYCGDSYRPSYFAASATATAGPTATASAGPTATATATALPESGGLTSPLVGVGALMLLAGAGMVSVRIVRRSS
jgi:hypothetical protein